MIQALLAALIGALFLGIATVPPICFINACFGILYIGAGALSAWIWTKLSGGKASFAYCLISGALAGVIFTSATLGTAAVGLSFGSGRIAEAANENSFIQSIPEDQAPTAEQLLDLAEQHFQTAQGYTEDQRLMYLSQVEARRKDVAEARRTPERSKWVDAKMVQIHGLILSLKKGDISAVTNPLLLVLLVVGIIISGLSSIGGLIGGLCFGDDGPRPEPGEAA